MGLTDLVSTSPARDEQAISYYWYVGIAWGSQQHQVCVLDRDRHGVGQRVVDHTGSSLAQFATWLWALSAGQPHRGAVGLEVPRGGAVGGVVERGLPALVMHL